MKRVASRGSVVSPKSLRSGQVMREYHRRKTQVQTGEISGVRNCGTIVIVLLRIGPLTTPVFFDHRQFQCLLDGEHCRPDQLIGRSASFDGEALRLLDSRTS